MSAKGRLEDQEPAELIRGLARRAASGKLVLTRRDAHAVLVFRGGRIIYAASSALRETFGNILVLRGLVSEADLLEALERQHRSETPQRLGQVLVDMGKVELNAMREVMRRQAEDVLVDLVRWRTGFFHFEPLDISPGGEVEVDLRDLLQPEGFSPHEMLGDTPPFLASAARVALSEVTLPSPAPEVTAEATLRLMRYAAQVFGRGVLFVVRPEELRGMGQFGVDVPGDSPTDRVRETVVPLHEPSVLRDAVEKRETYRGPLSDSRWDRHLVHRLGGQSPREVVVIPMIVGGAVSILFYGDDLPDHRTIGPLDALEFMIAEAGVAMERALVEGRERSLLEKRQG